VKRNLSKPSPAGAKKAVKGGSAVDYVLLMTPCYSERKRRPVTYLALRSVKQFRSFRYDIVVEHRLDGNTLYLDIRGLRPPELTLPGVGPAIFETEYDNLAGNYEVVITKLHKEVNRFHVRIAPEKVLVEKSPRARFIDLVTRMEDW